MTMDNINVCLCVEPVKQDIDNYLRNVLCDLFRREWQLDNEVIAELENAADCAYFSSELSENTISMHFGTTYASNNLKARNVIDWILEVRAPAILNTYANEELTNAIQSNPEPIKEFISQEIANTLQKGG